MESSIPSRHSFLVDDLVPFIVDQIALESSFKDVASLALISSKWVNPTRRILYGSPRLRSYHSCYLLSRTLAENPGLDDHVHALHLHPVTRHCSSGVRCNCHDVNAFALSLAPLFRLTNLSEVSLGGDCAIHAEWYLRSFTNPQSIRKLRVEGMPWYWSQEINRPVAASLHWSEALATRLTNLEHLELVNLDLHVSDLRAFKPRPPYLQTLLLLWVRIRGGKLSNLAFNTWGNLKKLAVIVSEYSPDYDISTILAQASKRLVDLQILIKDAGGQDDLDMVVGVGALTSCTSLRQLQLSVPFGIKILQTLSDRLKHLELLKVYGS